MTRLRQLWLLTALGSLAALVGGYFLLVSPQNTKAAALREETDTQLQMNRQIQSQIDMLNKQKKALPEQQALLSRFTGLVPSNPALPRLVRALSDAADNSGVELVGISPKLPEWAKGFDAATRTEMPGKVSAPDGHVLVAIAVQLQIAGEYSQVTQFFSELEEMNRALVVGGFAIKRADKAPRQATGTEVIKDLNQLTATIETTVWMTKKAPVTVPTAPPTTDTELTK